MPPPAQNKSSNSVNILVRAQVARCQLGNIFSRLKSIVPPRSGRGGVGEIDLGWSGAENTFHLKILFHVFTLSAPISVLAVILTALEDS